MLFTGKLSDLQTTRVTFDALNCPCNAGDFNELFLLLKKTLVHAITCNRLLWKSLYRLQNKVSCIVQYGFSLKINIESSEVLGDVFLKYDSSHICTSEAVKHFTSLSKADLPQRKKPFLPNVNVKF